MCRTSPYMIYIIVKLTVSIPSLSHKQLHKGMKQVYIANLQYKIKLPTSCDVIPC